VNLPPLRERADDIALLAGHFVEKLAAARQRPAPALSPEALERLRAHSWPGNVRELENVLERAVTLATGPLLRPEDLALEGALPTAGGPALPARGMRLEAVKRWYVRRVLDEVGGNKQRAAEVLGVDRRTLYRLLARQSEPG
jgi:DNA-binding NtrC family response regulator